jgi:hypothetical protein
MRAGGGEFYVTRGLLEKADARLAGVLTNAQSLISGVVVSPGVLSSS